MSDLHGKGGGVNSKSGSWSGRVLSTAQTLASAQKLILGELEIAYQATRSDLISPVIQYSQTLFEPFPTVSNDFCPGGYKHAGVISRRATPNHTSEQTTQTPHENSACGDVFPGPRYRTPLCQHRNVKPRRLRNPSPNRIFHVTIYFDLSNAKNCL